MQTVTEIQTKLAELVAAMVEKGVVTPSAQLQIKDSAVFCVHCQGKYDTRPFDGEHYLTEVGDTPAEALAAAAEYIAALPSPEETVTRTYLRKVADAVDYAKENGVDDEYVTPLRGVTCAMTENLLTDQRVAS
ncbi:hypothetical protein [Sulfitobacter pacificus]|uniref:hypothetical protein n=1 Tax=Sulfitobacter pacificus TaxID=1499314 RepID=UPI003104AF90